MPDQNQGASGSAGAGGADQKGAGAAQGQAGAQGAGQGDQLQETVAKAIEEKLTVALRAINENVRRQTASEAEKIVAGLETKLGDKLQELVAKATEGRQSGGRKDKEDQDPARQVELLTKKITELEKAAVDARKTAEAAELARRDALIQSKAQEVLGKNDCLMPEAVVKLIRDRLDLADDGKVLASAVDRLGQNVRIPVEEFVKGEVRETYALLFKGAGRDGSPLSGDKAGGKKFLYTKAQYEDLDYYVKHQAEMDQALVMGQVEGVESLTGQGARR